MRHTPQQRSACHRCVTRRSASHARYGGRGRGEAGRGMRIWVACADILSVSWVVNSLQAFSLTRFLALCTLSVGQGLGFLL